MKKGVIFDLDGVLLSTDELHYRAWKKLADRLGIPFDRSDNDRQRGVSRMRGLEILLERADRAYSPEEMEALADEKNETYRALLEGLSPADVSEEVRETLKALKEMGCKLAVGSASRNTRRILERTALTRCFDAISDGNNVARSKPDPEVFLKAAQFIGLAPADCVVVEDACSGIDAAVAGGFECVGIGDA